MSRNIVLLMVCVLLAFFNSYGAGKEKDIEVITKIEMNLSAFGVESDNFPSIYVFINLETDSNFCERTYYDPKYKSSNYTLSKTELNQIKNLLKIPQIIKLKQSYTTDWRDLPTSTTKIITNKNIYTIKDYGLMGDNPLPEVYKIVYKFEY